MANPIVGNIVGIPNPQPDWLQEDRTKADFIKNKPFKYLGGVDLNQILPAGMYSIDYFESSGTPEINSIDIEMPYCTLMISPPKIIDGGWDVVHQLLFIHDTVTTISYLFQRIIERSSQGEVGACDWTMISTSENGGTVNPGDIDLSDYYTKNETDEMLKAKANANSIKILEISENSDYCTLVSYTYDGDLYKDFLLYSKEQVDSKLSKKLNAGVTASGDVVDSYISDIQITDNNNHGKDILVRDKQDREIIQMSLYTADGKVTESSNNLVTSGAVYDAVDEVVSIAKGRATGYVFDTTEDMHEWLSEEENKKSLTLGDNLYIRALDVPDYWWDGSAIQPLETQKVDLSEYVQKEDEFGLSETRSVGLHLNEDDALLSINYQDGSSRSIRLYDTYQITDSLAGKADIPDIVVVTDSFDLMWNLGENTETYFKNPITAETGFMVAEPNSYDLYNGLQCYCSFRTGDTVPTVTTSVGADLKWIGDDCDGEGNFTPIPNASYEVHLKCVSEIDGVVHAVARVGYTDRSESGNGSTEDNKNYCTMSEVEAYIEQTLLGGAW